jgi:hypothetical protein
MSYKDEAGDTLMLYALHEAFGVDVHQRFTRTIAHGIDAARLKQPARMRTRRGRCGGMERRITDEILQANRGIRL